MRFTLRFLALFLLVFLATVSLAEEAGDLLTITRVDSLVKQKKIIEAQQLAGSIASEETRAWALLAVATVAVNAGER